LKCRAGQQKTENQSPNYQIYFLNLQGIYTREKMGLNNCREDILVVDDDPDILALFERLFTGEGYRVTTASNGCDALEQFKSHPADVAVVDIKIPGMDGIELSWKIKEINAPTEIILISGFSTMDSAISSVKLGAFDYFCKPFKLKEVSRSVERALEKRHTQDQHENNLLENIRKMQLQQREIQERLEKFQIKYSDLIDNSPDGILELNSKGKIVKFNPAVSALTGYSAIELQYCSIRDLFGELAHPDDFLKTVEKLGEIRDWEISPATRWAKSRIFNVSVWVSVEQSEPVFRMLLRDVTDHKQLSDKLFQSQKLAKLGQVAAGIVHELKNPLTVISASAQFCLEHYALESDLAEHFSTIYSNVKNANRIISELLHFARPTEVTFVSGEMNAILVETLKLVKPELEQRQLHLTTSLAKKPLPVKCDSRQIQQVLINLLLNAFQASSAGSTVTISSDIDSEKQMVRVEVSDAGMGIAAKHLTKIFEPFFTLKKGGTGLGLAICQHIIVLHHGKITVESTPNVGTRFTVLLPVSPSFKAVKRLFH
jgi:PAS domain S-box-containing protein